MKLKPFVVAAFLATVTSSNAANYFVSNLVTGTGSSEALFQNAGAANASLLDGGIVALGYFGSNAYVPSSSLGDIASTISNFTIAASALAGGFSAQLQADLPAGYVDAAVVDTAPLTGSNALIGRTLYVFVGNGTTLENSTAWALKAVGTLQDEEGAEGDFLANPLGGAAPVLGSINPNAFTGDPLGFGQSSTFSALQLAAIPEPSAALLGLIGAVGLFRRRR